MALDLSRLSEIAKTFDANIDPLITLVASGAAVGGVILVAYSIYQLPTAAINSRNGQTSGRGSYMGVVFGILIGSLLLYMPTLLDSLRETIFAAEKSPLSGVSSVQGLGADMSRIFLTLLHFIQFVGILAVIRSLFIFNKLANGGGQEASWGKGITLLLGGALAANIVLTANMFFETFGLTYKII